MDARACDVDRLAASSVSHLEIATVISRLKIACASFQNGPRVIVYCCALIVCNQIGTSHLHSSTTRSARDHDRVQAR